MIRLTPFDLQIPATLEEAAAILSQGNGDAKILAGGTDLVAGMKQGISRPKTVVWLGKIPGLRQVTFSPEQGLSIGAMCTLSEIEQNPHVAEYYPSVVHAIRSVASPPIRNRATIGGNICLNTRCFYYDQTDFWRNSLGYCVKHGDGVCHAAPELSRCTAVFSSDLAPLLIALDATVGIQSTSSRKKLSLSQFYNNDGQQYLTSAPSDILVSVNIPYDPDLTSAHGKIRSRNSIDFALANAGVAVKFNRKGECEQARIIVGAVSSSPIDAADQARRLVGQKLTGELIEEIAGEVSQLVRPMPNVDGAVSYRKKMVRVVVQRALQHLTDRSLRT